MRKIFIFLIFSFFLFSLSYSTEIENLISIALKNNQEIMEAENTYKSALLSSKTVNGVYSPSFSISTSSVFENKKNILYEADQFSSTIDYAQPLPGSVSLGIRGTYSFIGTELNQERYIVQMPNISFSFSQSLFPFWIQGKLKDPSKLSLELQKIYYYNQLIYTKKSVLQDLIQNYANALIYKTESEIYKTSISFLEDQLEAQRELKKSGNTNQSKIIELENNRWNNYQNNLTSISYYENYIQNIKNLCGEDFEFEIGQSDLIEDIFVIPEIKEIQNIDPLEENFKMKIELLNSERIQQRQNSAPVVSVTVQPNWKTETEKQKEWRTGLRKIEKIDSWNTGVSVNFSPFISSTINKNKEKFRLEYEKIVKNRELYLSQKNFIKQQYQKILIEYEKQMKATSVLWLEAQEELSDYEALYRVGGISKLDYDSVLVRVKNIELSLQSLQINMWLYKNLIEITN